MPFDLLLAIITFLAGFLIVFGVNLVVTDVHLSDERERRAHMLSELRIQQRADVKKSIANMENDFASIAAEAMEETAAGQMPLSERLEAMIWQAGMKIQVERLLMVCALIGIVLCVIVLGVTGVILISFLIGVVGAAIPIVVVQVKRTKRIEELRGQLPDSFDLMSRVMRAGQTISQGMLSVAQEMPPPISLEFGYCYEQQNLGLNPEIALRDLARRTGLLEVKIFVLALIVHRQTGGNLTDLLEKLSEIVRDRYRIRAKVKGMTSEGRMQGLILMFLPLFVYGIMLVMNRPYAIKLFDHPWLPITSVIMICIGGLWIRKIVNFDF